VISACDGGGVHVVNVATCEPEEVLERGAFGHAETHLTSILGAAVIGASVYTMRADEACWPYHYHHGVEEWMYVVSGAPVLRSAGGERTLEPGELVAFSAGAQGAHTYRGPGRIVVFSAGARGWGEGFVTVYPDSDKLGGAPGIIFRRADAVDAWRDEERPATSGAPATIGTAAVNLLSLAADGVALGPRLGARTWAATLSVLARGQAAAPYRYEWCREEYALVLDGAPTLRHPDGERTLGAGDMVCFGQGPDGARQWRNDDGEAARLIAFSTPPDGPMSAFYPDDDMVELRLSNREGFRFRRADQIENYWDGEPGAGPA
jgi:uncharacterized cupin superfamily protein